MRPCPQRWSATTVRITPAVPGFPGSRVWCQLLPFLQQLPRRKKPLCRAGDTFPADPGQAWERAKKKGTACPDGRNAHLFRAQEAELRERAPKKRESRHGVHTHAMPAERLIGRIRLRDRAFPACGLDHGAQGISVDARHQFPVCLHRCQGGQKA